MAKERKENTAMIIVTLAIAVVTPPRKVESSVKRLLRNPKWMLAKAAMMIPVTLHPQAILAGRE